MSKAAKTHEPVGRKTYTDPSTGTKKEGAIVPLAKIRADEIWHKIRPYLEQHTIFGNRLVVAISKRPEKTEHGIILTEEYRQEDVWQGVCGLVVQRGPGCFIDSDKWKFYGQTAEVGDWVTFQPSHTILTKIGGERDGLECRIIQDSYILGTVLGPHVVF